MDFELSIFLIEPDTLTLVQVTRGMYVEVASLRTMEGSRTSDYEHETMLTQIPSHLNVRHCTCELRNMIHEHMRCMKSTRSQYKKIPR